MARTARTRGISMTSEVAALWDRLRGDRRPAQFLRELLEHEVQRREREAGEAALRWLEEKRAAIPASWYDPKNVLIGEDEHEDERALGSLPAGTRVTFPDGTVGELRPWRRH